MSSIKIYYIHKVIFLTLLLAANAKDCKAGGNDFLFAIDIGHSKKSPGVISARGVGEYKYNKNIGDKLKKEFEGNKFVNVFIINENGNEIPLKRRAEIANLKNAKLFLSIHHDSVQQIYLSEWINEGVKRHYSDLYSGFSIFISKNNREFWKSYLFAAFIGGQLLKEGFSPTLHHAENIKGENKRLIDQQKGIYEYDDLIVLKETKMAAVLFECGVIVNRYEEVKLNRLDSQRQIVKALTSAVREYYTNIYLPY